MANIPQLIAATSAALGFPSSSAILYGRNLREAGLLSQAGNGVNAAKATALDAATLLIALLVCPKAAWAPEYVADFGKLRSDSESFFAPQPTFLADTALLIENFGSRHVAAKVAATMRGDSSILKRTWAPAMVEVRINDTVPSCSVTDFFDSTVTYQVQLLSSRASLDGPDISLIEKYQRPVQSSKWIDGLVLAKIAACLYGVGFGDLLREALEIDAPGAADRSDAGPGAVSK